MKKNILTYALIILGSAIYAVGTQLFIFPHSLLLGGTSGIAVILNSFLPVSSGQILMCINILLMIVAFFVLGKTMAFKTFIGSLATTFFVGIAEMIFSFDKPIVPNEFVSAVLGGTVIAIASGILFYVDSSSGGTDIIALIIKKFSNLNIGKALLVSDILIVIIGGSISGILIALASFIGLLIKTLGIDFVIFLINKAVPNKIKK